MIRPAFIFPACMVAALVTGSFILQPFRHLSTWSLFILVLLILAGCFYAYTGKPVNLRAAVKEFTGGRLTAFSSSLLLFAACFAGVQLAHTWNRAKLYIDNGTANAILVHLHQEATVIVPANDFLEKQVPVGNILVSYSDSTTRLQIKSGGKWVLNLNNENIYLRTTLDRSVYMDADNAQPADPDSLQLIREFFFKADARHIFRAPESYKSKPANSNMDKQTILLRLQDLYSGEEEL